MKPDEPCKMGLTDPCPWVDKKKAQFMKRSIMNKCYEINRILTEIEPKYEMDSGRCAINEDLFYKGIT